MTNPQIPADYDMAGSKYQLAVRSIDEEHAKDPTIISVDGIAQPSELFYSQQMCKYLEKRCPSASEPLRLAVRAQHLKRWEVPRDSFAMGKKGYLLWRTHLKKRQAELAQHICLTSGYSMEDSTRVAALIRKENLKKDVETQVLEDVACLVFLDVQFEGFEQQHDEDKIVSILRKTWAKMSDEGHALAVCIPMSDRAAKIVAKALFRTEEADTILKNAQSASVLGTDHDDLMDRPPKIESEPYDCFQKEG